MNQMLERAFEAWCGCEELRSRRRRYKRYTFGDQWSDPVEMPSGKWSTEWEFAVQDGKRPQTNNIIRQLVKSVVGRFRYRMVREKTSAAELGVDREVAVRNHLDELDCRSMEEFLISGCVVQRVVMEKRMAGDGVWVDIVSPEKFFVNRFTDPRGFDIELVGMLHDMSIREVMMRFGDDARRCEELAKIYSDSMREMNLLGGVPAVGDAAASEFYHGERGKCRVIEVWSLESRNVVKCHDTHRGKMFIVPESEMVKIERLNRSREAVGEGRIEIRQCVTMRWHVRFFSPSGVVLDEYDSPFGHNQHPFAVKFYPMIDGEVHSFVEDVIDQQRHVNRLITLIDHVMGVSAKGVLLFPEEQRLPGMSWGQVADAWSDCNGVLPYRVGRFPGIEPHQVVSSGGNAGASDLLQIELRLMEQVSGVSGALQGRHTSGVNSAALYEAQTDNSVINLLDLIEAFESFRAGRNDLVNECGVCGWNA